VKALNSKGHSNVERWRIHGKEKETTKPRTRSCGSGRTPLCELNTVLNAEKGWLLIAGEFFFLRCNVYTCAVCKDYQAWHRFSSYKGKSSAFNPTLQVRNN